MTLWVTLEDIARGGPRTISVGTQHGTHAVEIEIPQGIAVAGCKIVNKNKEKI